MLHAAGRITSNDGGCGNGRPGRPAAATREVALALATKRFLKCERVNVQAIARELGLARATMHRWFQTREALLGELLAEMGEHCLLQIRAETPGGRARALLATFDRFNRELAAFEGMRAFLAQEQERAVRVLTFNGRIVQPRVVGTVQRVIEVEVEAGRYAPKIDPAVLAYAIVRLGEAFLYTDAMVGISGDIDRLREIEGALLGG